MPCKHGNHSMHCGWCEDQARITELESEVKALRHQSQENALQQLASEGQWIEQTGALRAENEQLRKLAACCYAGLGAECDLPEEWLDALSNAANGEPFDLQPLLPFSSALRADAERYRWLRDKASGGEWESIGHGTTPETTDAAIDAARQQPR